MDDAMIDEALSGALERLTANEKECLRRRLNHQSAKEMALELGISPHAVEKRLKMARAKLGLSSSLEAARALEAWERYGHAGSQASDLAIAAPRGKGWFTRPTALGVIVMSLIAATLIFVAQQGVAPLASGGAVPLDSGGVALMPSATAGETKAGEVRMLSASEFVDGTPEEIRVFAEEVFRGMDSDGSGFVEREEAPALTVQYTDTVWDGHGPPPREWYQQQEFKPVPIEPVMAKAAFIAKGDSNADGKLSFDEYLAQRASGFDGKLVPIKWREERQARR
jgi:DNA-binding CsgD family transcriptional regulator